MLGAPFQLAAASVPMAWALVLLLAGPAVAAEGVQRIVSDGPLTEIIVSTELNCQVRHRDDLNYELFGGEQGACGTFLALDETLYGPSVVPSGAGLGVLTSWAAASQSPPAGSGTAADPLRIVTVVDAPGSGLRVEQTDSYAVGSESYRTDVRITNMGAAAQAGVLYRAGDCYLQESDEGYGRVDGEAPACVTDRAEGSRIEQWLPISAGSRYMEGRYSDVWAHIGTRQPFTDTCLCDEQVDNGAGLSWPVSIAAGESVTVSHATFFSPLGRAAVQESLRNSVPDISRISLDPIIVAQSVAIAVGVILLIPFPSALFNATLEEHYDEVMAAVAGVRTRLRAWTARAVAWARAQIAARRAGVPPANAPPANVAPTADGTAFGAPMPGPRATPGTRATPGPTAGEPAAPPRDLWRTPQGMLLFILLSGLVYAFLDPTFGFNLESIGTLAGLVLGLAVITLAYGVPLLAYARVRGIAVLIKALPATLAVGIGCVIVSRLTDFQPGYVYGLIIGFLFARTVALEHEGRAEALAAACALVAALVAWVSLAFLRGSGAPGDLGAVAAQTAAVTVVVAGLEGAVFAMLPVRFMPGAAVLGWDKRVWAVLIGLGVFGFVHILLNPITGYLADETRTSFVTMVVLLVGFGLASVLFWAWFRFRPARQVAP